MVLKTKGNTLIKKSKLDNKLYLDNVELVKINKEDAYSVLENHSNMTNSNTIKTSSNDSINDKVEIVK